MHRGAHRQQRTFRNEDGGRGREDDRGLPGPVGADAEQPAHPLQDLALGAVLPDHDGEQGVHEEPHRLLQDLPGQHLHRHPRGLHPGVPF